MDENEKGTNEEEQAQADGTQEGKIDVEAIEQTESTAVSHTVMQDKPSSRKKWGALAGSFLVGVLLTFAVTYFLLGAQKDAVAEVNGEKITQDEFVEAVASGGGAQVLDQLITEKLIQQKAKQENVTVSDKDYEEKVAEIKEQLPSEDMFEQALAQQGLTEETFREQMETNLLLEKMLAPELKVSDKEIRQYFDDNKEQFGQPEQVNAKQIVVESEEEAKKAHKRLVDGEDFAKVAKDVSIDPQTKDNGGDLGTVSKGDLAQMDPDLEEKIFALNKGELSEPIEGLSGFYIVQVEDKIAAKEGKFDDDVAQQITEQLKQQKLQEKAPDWIQKLREDAEIDNILIPEDAAQVMQG